MASINPINFLSNRNGIPRIASTSVSVNTADVTFNFSSDFTFSRNFSGLVLVKLDQSIPSGTTTTLPVLLSSAPHSGHLVLLSSLLGGMFIGLAIPF